MTTAHVTAMLQALKQKPKTSPADRMLAHALIGILYHRTKESAHEACSFHSPEIVSIHDPLVASHPVIITRSGKQVVRKR
jgi:hypothetical protein